MKKIILSLFALSCASASNAAVLAQYNFSEENLNASTTATHVSNTAISAFGFDAKFKNNSGTDNDYYEITDKMPNSSGYNLVPQNFYFQFTVSAQTGYQLANMNISLDYRTDISGGNSPDFQVYYAVNGSTTYTALGSAVEATSTTFQSFTSPFSANNVSSVTFRVFAYSSPSKDLHFDNITVNGDVDAVTPVPEPTNIALAAFGTVFAGIGIGRKFLRKKA